jgi:hypothetical protein
MRLTVILVAVSLSLALVACGRSTEEITKEWNDLVAEAAKCEADAECVLVTPGCPLGCSAIVNQSQKTHIEAKAEELRMEASAPGMSCQYSCILPTDFTCENEICVGN